MSNTFTDPQKYLLKNWKVSSQLEESMQKVRESYSAIGEQIAAKVQGTHEDLDSYRIYLTQKWSSGFISFGRKNWDKPKEFYISGFSLENIRLESLVDETVKAPLMSIWFNKPEKLGVNMSSLIDAIHSNAPSILSKEELALCDLVKTKDCALLYPLPGGKLELLNKLADGNSSAFIDCVTSHFEVLIKFTPIIESVYAGKNA